MTFEEEQELKILELVSKRPEGIPRKELYKALETFVHADIEMTIDKLTGGLEGYRESLDERNNYTLTEHGIRRLKHLRWQRCKSNIALLSTIVIFAASVVSATYAVMQYYSSDAANSRQQRKLEKPKEQQSIKPVQRPKRDTTTVRVTDSSSHL